MHGQQNIKVWTSFNLH